MDYFNGARSAWSYDEDDRSIRKGFLRPLLYKPLEDVFLESRMIGTIVLG
ncbi:hypothetical protein [Rhizobium leguminosarum]|nr:hypothetical protein [Rhizobium leguminosarum]MBY3026694.1 hypothetical protein [Rhizobium leguminosarum]